MTIPEDVLVNEIMTRSIAVIDKDASIQKAAMLLRKKNIHGLVVISGKTVTGMLSDKDIISKVVSENKSPREIKVCDVMSPKLIVAKPTDNIAETTRIMFANDISRLPVVDEEGNLAGIITVRDMLRVYPGINEILNEELELKESQAIPERTIIEGRCEECDNIVDELIEIDRRWLCTDCRDD